MGVGNCVVDGVGRGLAQGQALEGGCGVGIVADAGPGKAGKGDTGAGDGTGRGHEQAACIIVGIDVGVVGEHGDRHHGAVLGGRRRIHIGNRRVVDRNDGDAQCLGIGQSVAWVIRLVIRGDCQCVRAIEIKIRRINDGAGERGCDSCLRAREGERPVAAVIIGEDQPVGAGQRQRTIVYPKRHRDRIVARVGIAHLDAANR